MENETVRLHYRLLKLKKSTAWLSHPALLLFLIMFHSIHIIWLLYYFTSLN